VTPHPCGLRRDRAVGIGVRLACSLVVLSGCSTLDDPSVVSNESSAPPSPSASSRPSRTPARTAAPQRTTTQSNDPLARYIEQKVAWSDCREGFQCATVRVPLDYRHPARRAIGLSVNRLRATGPRARRVGSLLVNPGGPGESGLSYARQAQQRFSPRLLARFDIVGFDPRGVGASTPVRCLTDAETDRFLALDGSPDSNSERQALVRAARSFDRRCQARSGGLLAHIGTRDAARDMDILRAVLGDKKLHYLGKSYGTLLGATYADEFPARVGTMVLDGALDPRLSAEQVSLEQGRGFEGALRSFVADCLHQSDCPLGSTSAEAQVRVRALLAAADKTPLPGRDNRKITQSLVTLGILSALYDSATGWPLLRVALARALQDGDGSVLEALVDAYTNRGPDGSYRSNSNDAIYAVNCIDRPDARSVRELQARTSRFRAASPLFGDYLNWGSLPCVTWPVKPRDKPRALHASGADAILVVGTVRDPATPYAWAKALAHQLDGGRLLTWDGDGHTAYGRGSHCVDKAVDRYLVKGHLPPVGKRCAAGT
jgi:pimeloyl-ACP methyl ester carboxylesterase